MHSSRLRTFVRIELIACAGQTRSAGVALVNARTSGGEGQGEQIGEIVAAFEDAQARLHRLAVAIPRDRWTVREDAAHWSVAECVAHLNLTSKAFLPLLRAAVAEGRIRKLGRVARYRRDLLGWLISLMSGPMLVIGGFRFGRVKTTPAFVPGSGLDRDEVIADFDQLQTEQIGVARAADGLPLNDLKIVSPFDARVRYNAYSALVILPRHQHRHLAQAERVWRGR